MKYGIVGLSVLSAACALAVPRVDENTVTMQQADDRTVTISYVLTGEPGIVTFDVETNVTGTAEGPWVSIGGENIRTVAGWVNKLVGRLGERLSFTWQPYTDWPGRTIPAANIRAVVTAWATNAPPDYMAVDLDTPTNVSFYTSADFLPGSITSKVWRTRKLLMRKIPAANVVWRMGQPENERNTQYGTLKSTLPNTQQVMLTEDYYAGVFKLTAYQYWKGYGSLDPYNRAIGSTNEWGEPNDEAPACRTYWNLLRNGAISDYSYGWPQHGHTVKQTSVIAKFREKTGIEFDLPTEAQWEYAMRAGEGDACYLGGFYTSSNANLIAWHRDNRTKTINGKDVNCFSHQCGKLLPNNWGLYDMVGNGREWCLDYYYPYVTGGTPDGDILVDPKGPTSVETAAVNNNQYHRINRTSSSVKPWDEQSGHARSSSRQDNTGVDETFSCRFFCPATITIPPVE